jgi:hypothetical protein
MEQSARELKRQREIKYRLNLRLEMVAAYGGMCQKCKISDPIVLVLDHILDNAQEDRRLNGHNGGYVMYRKLKEKGWPKDQHQLLCNNCNYRKEHKRRYAKY